MPASPETATALRRRSRRNSGAARLVDDEEPPRRRSRSRSRRRSDADGGRSRSRSRSRSGRKARASAADAAGASAGHRILDTVSVFLSLAGVALSLAIDQLWADLPADAAVSDGQGLVALVLGVVVFAITTVAAPVTHVLAVSKYPHFSYFQPFRGGGAFVALSVVAWALYTLALVAGFVYLRLCFEGRVPFRGLLPAAAVTGFGAQALVLFSLPLFDRPSRASRRAAASAAAGKWAWQSVAVGALVLLAVLPMTYLVVVEIFREHCQGASCAAPLEQLSIVARPLINPSFGAVVAAVGLVLLAAPVTHGVAGGRKYRQSVYEWIMPFRGGSTFVALHFVAWTAYAAGLVSLLAFAYTYVAHEGAMSQWLATVGGAGGFLAQVLVLLALPAFNPPAATNEEDADDEVSAGVTEKVLVWGRDMTGDWFASVQSGFMMATTPFLVLYFWISLDAFGGALSGPFYVAQADGVGALAQYLPTPTLAGLKVLAWWMLFQVTMMVYLPGPVAYGQLTPAGHRLPYRVNGWRAWLISHVAYFGGAYFGVWDLTVIYDHWGSLLVWTTAFGLSLTVFAYFKARTFPTHADDCKFSGSFLYDMFMGAEHNPRLTFPDLGPLKAAPFDFKLFFNGRPGIIAWSLINLSFAAAQYKLHGEVTNSMVAVLIGHQIYIGDFFYNEDWYLITIDISHDYFGFYLAYGDMVWLPYLYTLQAQYLARNPVTLPLWGITAVYFLLFAGYFIFRSVNWQKEYCRAAKGDCTVWGKPCEYIKTEFKLKDGTTRTSMLLTCGWWGLSRHFNYVGDLLMSTGFCVACGFGHLLPMFYIIYMTILLLHRTERDHARCHGKYGKYWDEYCRRVPYKVIPYLY